MTILFAAIVISIYAGKYLASRVGRQGHADRHVRLVWPKLVWSEASWA